MMTIKQIEVTVGEITRGYMNNDEQGVRGYDGQLDIRPPYQREFIYNEKEQQAVITTVLRGYPLNVMYWVRRSEDAECPYEVMDGQQRTLSLCEYVAGKYSYDFKNFFNQPEDVQRRILDYRLTVYVCEGDASEKLEWFKTINIAGKPLNEQEINNAIYAGPFVSDAKRHFSKSNCGAYRLGKDLVNGTPIRQDYLKTALEWMAEHETRGGKPQLIIDSEVTRKQGIIPYVLTGDEHYLDLRAFPDDIKLAVWEQQGHRCTICGKEFDLEFMEADHITPWKEGGRTFIENCQMLCRECNRRKGAK